MNTDSDLKRRLVIVSNRLPITLVADSQGRWKAEPGSGGLVTALAPVLRERGGLWIGWPGIAEKKGLHIDRLLREAVQGAGYTFKPVHLTENEIAGYYYGFANEILWPLFHDLQTRCNFDPGYWKIYQHVNRKFAEVIAANAGANDQIWVHDYHLMSVGLALRRMGSIDNIGYFLHIPFPPLDLFLKLPWRFEILEALLAYDQVGFQTQRDKRNFVHCVRAMRKDVTVHGKGRVLIARLDQRQVRIGNFPISIDFDDFARKAETPIFRHPRPYPFKILDLPTRTMPRLLAFIYRFHVLNSPTILEFKVIITIMQVLLGLLIYLSFMEECYDEKNHI